MLRHDFQHMRRLPAIKQARGDCLIGAAHQLCIEGAGDELVRHIALDPGCVTSRDCYGFTPLHWAVRSANMDAIEDLLQSGADVNAVCKFGRPALSWASSWIISKTLLDAGADITILDNKGNDAVFCALNSHAPKDVIELLLEASSKTDNQRLDSEQSTYLMVAILEASVDVCEMIIEYTADISAQDSFGFSALTYAIRHNCHAGMELLLDYGANTTQLDRDGDSIIFLVALFGDIETMRILQAEQIEGLPMEAEDIDAYWNEFYNPRNFYFLGWRAPIDEEEAAFQAFLDSIVPCEPRKPTPNPRALHVPGAFSLSEDGSDFEEDPDYDNSESDAETSDYESCDEELVAHEPNGDDIGNRQNKIIYMAASQTSGRERHQGGSTGNFDEMKDSTIEV
jgi:ankyrin repeat protein